MCTDLRLLNPRRFDISARNMDLGTVMQTHVSFVPAGTEYESLAPPLRSALGWRTRLDYVGLLSAPRGSLALLPAKYRGINIDAMNVKGLSAAALWNDDTVFPAIDEAPADARFLAEFNLVDWIVGSCATVDEVVAALADGARPSIWGVQIDSFGLAFRLMPCRFVVHDAQGKDLVIEMIDGTLVLTQPVCGVLANEPRMSWHLQNLANYVSLSFDDVKSQDFGGVKVQALGHNTGMLGLPGDFTSPSRFVRAVVLNRTSADADDLDTPTKAVAHAGHLIDSAAPPFHINSSGDFTQWQVIRDHNSLKYYIRTYFGVGTQRVDVGAVDFASLAGATYMSLGDDVDEPPALTPVTKERTAS
jgi:choloylglycine hydrolase